MLSTDYMEEFRCIGSECEDSCCAGWQVTIDKATFKKYQRVTQPALKATLNSSLKRNKGVHCHESNFARIKLDAQQACPLLDSAGLCQVHTHLGETALSKTCRSYPRILNNVDGMEEFSAKLSCPEVARLALLRPDGIEFRESSHNVKGLSCAANLMTENIAEDRPAHHFWQLQLHAIETLQDRRLPLWKRLLMLGLVYRKLDAGVDGGLDDKLIEQVASSYRAMFADADYSLSLDRLPANTGTMLGMANSFIELRAQAGVSHKRFLECHQLAMGYLTEGTAGTTDEAAERFTSAYEQWYAPFMAEHDYMLENYLVNFAFQTLMPVQPKARLSENYLTMVVNFAVIRLYLVGLAGARGAEFGVDDVLKLIQSFTKAVEHNLAFLESVRQYFVQQGYADLAHLSVLLREPEIRPATPAEEPTGRLQQQIA